MDVNVVMMFFFEAKSDKLLSKFLQNNDFFYFLFHKKLKIVIAK